MTASTEELQETEAAARPPAKVVHLTTAERAALGKAARAKTPRALHAALRTPGVGLEKRLGEETRLGRIERAEIDGDKPVADGLRPP